MHNLVSHLCAISNCRVLMVEELVKLLQSAQIPLWLVQPLTKFRITKLLTISAKTRRQATMTTKVSTE